MLKSVMLASALAFAAPLAAAPMEVLPSGHTIAHVEVDGRGPYRFVIDTAATNTSVLPKLRAAIPASMRAAGGQNLSGASGQVEIGTVVLDRLTAEGRTFRGLRAFALPPGPVDALGVDGVLGSDIVARYALEMDMPGRRWAMAERPTPAMLKGLLPPVPIELDSGMTPRLTVRIDGVDLPAILDTGARGTIMNWAAAKRLGLTPDSSGLTPAGSIQGVTSHRTPSVTKPFRAVEVGEARFTSRTIRIADLPIFGVLAFAEGEPAVIVGIDMLADRRFVVDHPGRRLHVSPPLGAVASNGRGKAAR